MDSNSGSTLDNDKAQHEALVQTLDVPESDTSTFSLIWRPAALLLIPLVLTLTSIYLSFSWTVYFENNLDTANWTHMGNYFGPDDVNWYCFSNGTAAPQLMKANSGMATVWDTNQFLDITLGFGSFEFGVAKGIDIGWDLVVGRGGQILLALFSYRVCSAVLLHSMETRAVSLYTYTAVGFDRGPLLSIWASLRDLWSGRSQGKGVLSMVIFASLYLLAFPTFVSTMTGYKPNWSPWVYLSKDDAMYPAENILPVILLIKDGSRIGLTDDFPIVHCVHASSCSTFEATLEEEYWRYRFSTHPGINDEPSSFMVNGNNFSLPPPRLTFVDVADQFWIHDNKTYTMDDMRGTCQPDKTYQWGFSFLALLAFCVTTTLYTITMYILWLRTFLHSREHRARQQLGLFRAAMNFADTLKAQVGEDCTDKTEKELADLVNSYELGICCNDVDELPPSRRSLIWKAKFTLRHFPKWQRGKV